MNHTVLKGNLARDPEVKEITANGRTTTVANFTLAVSRFFKKADGTNDKDVTFIPCELWDTGAQSVQKYVKKGDPMLVEGSLKVESWEKDGQKHSRMKVRVNHFERLYRSPGRDEEGIPTDEAQPTPVEAGVGLTGAGEDIPF
jgi:single-strand DNA-binding protein